MNVSIEHLNVFAALHGESFGIGESTLAHASDTAALFMLGLLTFILTCIAFLALHLRKTARTHSPERRLLDEMEGEARLQRQTLAPRRHQDQQPPPTDADWEREADWWKK